MKGCTAEEQGRAYREGAPLGPHGKSSPPPAARSASNSGVRHQQRMEMRVRSAPARRGTVSVSVWVREEGRAAPRIKNGLARVRDWSFQLK